MKSENEWKDKLTPEQYQVCRCSATEPPFDNEYWDCKDSGKYHCVCCDEILFELNTNLILELGGLAFTNLQTKK